MSTTEKFDLDLTDYGLTGWNAILKGSIEAIDEYMQERIVGSLVTAVSKGEVLFWDTSEVKYGKAIASAASTPAIGLAWETGSPGTGTFDIRILREGYISNSGWSLTTGANIYVSAATLGGISMGKPAAFAQYIGYALSATKIYVDIKPPELFHYGTGDPPTPTGYPDGVVYIKYTA